MAMPGVVGRVGVLNKIQCLLGTFGTEAERALASEACTPIKQQIPLSGVGGQAPFWKLLSVCVRGALSIGGIYGRIVIQHVLLYITPYITFSSRVLSAPAWSLTTGQILLPMVPKPKQSASNACFEVHAHTSKRLRGTP
jgi:hypothetical protein